MRSLIPSLLLAPIFGQDVFLFRQGRLQMEADADAIPELWVPVGDTADSQLMELTFAVKQQNIDKLHDNLMRVSDPLSEGYGQHLSRDDVDALTAPAQKDVDAVLSFLAEHEATGVRATNNGDMITARVSVAVAETMLRTNYITFTHQATNLTAHRAPSGYSLPVEVAAAVDFVAPTVHMPGVQVPRQVLADSNSYNTPKNLRQLYSIGDVEGKSEAPQAVTAFLKQYYSENALKNFWSTYCDKNGLHCGKGLPKLVGDATTGSPGVESMLDIEYITGVGGNIPSEFWGFSGTSPDNVQNEPFMKWIAEVANTADADVPRIFSTSYGEDESSWSESAASRLNTEFMKIGARGISLLFASGDSGANCQSGKYKPNTPASSPYVTAVGGTTPASGFPAPGSESAVGLSSGGFSNYFDMPDYQKDAVSAYLSKSGLPSASRGYNVKGRAYPDIAAQATNFCVTPFGCGVAGTSCASPTAAGIFGLLNDLRAQSGKPSLGFLNPLLYSLPADSFQDITTGHSNGCTGEQGWPATQGWDAVTGLGTINFEKLSKSLP